jgi:hypothetical protein
MPSQQLLPTIYHVMKNQQSEILCLDKNLLFQIQQESNNIIRKLRNNYF